MVGKLGSDEDNRRGQVLSLWKLNPAPRRKAIHEEQPASGQTSKSFRFMVVRSTLRCQPRLLPERTPFESARTLGAPRLGSNRARWDGGIHRPGAGGFGASISSRSIFFGAGAQISCSFAFRAAFLQKQVGWSKRQFCRAAIV